MQGHSERLPLKSLITNLLLLFLLSASAISTSAAEPETAGHWKKLLSRVSFGMRRATVEKILSRSDTVLDFEIDPKADAKKEKAGRTALYIFDDDWCATITFDSSGFTTRNNSYLVLHLPENKVIAPPQLLRRTAVLNEKIEKDKPK